MKTVTPSMPHSWAAKNWPPSVFPNDASKAGYLLKAHKDELLAVGALSRVGKDLIVYGEGWGRFLAKGTQKVANYMGTAAAARSARKRARCGPSDDLDRKAA